MLIKLIKNIKTFRDLNETQEYCLEVATGYACSFLFSIGLFLYWDIKTMSSFVLSFIIVLILALGTIACIFDLIRSIRDPDYRVERY